MRNTIQRSVFIYLIIETFPRFQISLVIIMRTALHCTVLASIAVRMQTYNRIPKLIIFLVLMLQVKPPFDNKNQTTSETEIITTEILGKRHLGIFNERTEYKIRKSVIPVEMPKTVRGTLFIVCENSCDRNRPLSGIPTQCVF